MVIAKGQFQQESMLALLRHDDDTEDKRKRTNISEEVLEMVLDRNDLHAKAGSDENSPFSGIPECFLIEAFSYEKIYSKLLLFKATHHC